MNGLRLFPQHTEMGGCSCGCSMSCITWVRSHSLAGENRHRFGNKQLGDGKINWALCFCGPDTCDGVTSFGGGMGCGHKPWIRGRGLHGEDI